MATGVFLSYPTRGHLSPALGVIAELARRGERVVCFATERYRSWIESLGAEYRAYAHREDELNPQPPTAGLFSDMARLGDLTEAMLPNLVDELRGLAPDYLLLDSKSLWGNLARQVLGLPAATLSVVFAIREGLIDVPQLVPHLYNGASREQVVAGLRDFASYTATAQRLDRRWSVRCPGVVSFLGNPQDLNVVFTSRRFQLAGDHFDDGYAFVGPSLGPRPDAGDFPFDELGDEPLIYVSLGTVFNTDLSFYRACFAAFGDRPVRVVLSVGQEIDRAALGVPPSNFLVRSFVPQLAVLERASLFVTHGGMNSANEGLLHGVPLLVVPQRGDQHLVAARVTELGAGLGLHPSAVDAERLWEMASRILDEPSFKSAAVDLSADLASAGGPVRAADEILARLCLKDRGLSLIEARGCL